MKNIQLEGELRSAYLRLEDAAARLDAAHRREQVRSDRKMSILSSLAFDLVAFPTFSPLFCHKAAEPGPLDP